uniref:Uncharacterized protein n=1 Tax=Magallana gigas TaxID=29159 RepID=K1QQ72_MAGGI
MAALNRVKIYTGYGSEILELSLDIPANPGGGEVLPDPDHRQRNEGLHSSGSGIYTTDGTLRMKLIRAMMSVQFLFFLGIFVLDSTAHQGHDHHQSPATPQPGPRPFQPGTGEQKCMVIVRRTFLEKEMVIFPCFKPVRGVTPVAAHQSSLGLVCRGYTTIPTTKYIRMSICCPGWYADEQGRCTKVVDDRGRESQMPRVNSPVQEERPMSLDRLSKYPSSYDNGQFGPMMRTQPPSDRWTPNDMAMRRIQNMMGQRLKLIEMIERKMKEREQITTAPSVPRSPVVKLYPTVRKFITVKKSFIPARKAVPPQQKQPNRFPTQPSNNSPSRLPPVQQIPRIPQPPQNKPHIIIAQKKQFAQVPQTSSPQYKPIRQSTHIRINVPSVFPQIPQRPPMQQREMPQIPNTQGFPTPPPCFAAYLDVVQSCFKQAEVEMPPDHGILNGDYNYQGVCQKKIQIADCIKQSTHPCSSLQEHMLVRTTMVNTLSEIDRICRIDSIQGIEQRMSVGDDVNPPPTQVTHDHVHMHGDVIHSHPHDHPHDHSHDHSHDDHDHDHAHLPLDTQLEEKTVQVEPATEPSTDGIQFLGPSAQAQPDPVPEVKQEEIKPDVKQEVKQEIKEAIEEAKKDETVVMDVFKGVDTTVEKHMHAHPHVQHVHDEITHEYYLPLLIGTAIGVAAIFCLLLAILCICCRRRIKKKIYVEREPEKPKLFEGIYTIGVPPPVYEVNGIPPLSYEEVRGIKITGSPSSVRRHNEENAENSSRRGVVSDI